MPVYEATMSDGTVARFESDSEPSEQEVLAAVADFQKPKESPEPPPTSVTGTLRQPSRWERFRAMLPESIGGTAMEDPDRPVVTPGKVLQGIAPLVAGPLGSVGTAIGLSQVPGMVKGVYDIPETYRQAKHALAAGDTKAAMDIAAGAGINLTFLGLGVGEGISGLRNRGIVDVPPQEAPEPVAPVLEQSAPKPQPEPTPIPIPQPVATRIESPSEESSPGVKLQAQEVTKSEELPKPAESVKPAEQTKEEPVAKPSPDDEVKPEAKNAEQKYQVKGSGPQTYSVLERLPQSAVEKEAGEQPVRIRNDKTGAETTVLETDLSPVKSLEGKAKAQTPKRDLDAELRAAKMDPSVFPDAASKRAALKRQKGLGPGSQSIEEPPYSAAQQLTDKLEVVQPFGAREALSARERIADASEAAKTILGKALAKAQAVSATIKETSRGVRPITGLDQTVGELDWLLQRSSAESNAMKAAIPRQMPNETLRSAVALWIDSGGDEAAIQNALAILPKETNPSVRRALQAAANLPSEVKDFAIDLKDYFGRRMQDASESEVFKNGLEDYFTHVWERPENMPDSLRSAITNGKVNEYFQFSRKRSIPTLLEGILQGKTPKLDPAVVLPFYNYALDRAIASRHFIADTSKLTEKDGRPTLLPTGTAARVERGDTADSLIIRPKARSELGSDYRKIDHPALRKWKWAGTDPESGQQVFYEGDLSVHPDAYNRLANMLDRGRLTPSSFARVALRASSEVKAFKLSSLPSAFHTVHVGSHALWHWTNPFRAPEIEWDSPMTTYAIERGHLKLAADPQSLSMAEDMFGKGLAHKIPFIGPLSKAHAEWLFTKYIPRLKLATFENAYARNLKWYAKDLASGKITQAEIAARVGDSINNAYGELNKWFLGKNGRDPRFQRLLQGIFLAPDFGEARGRFAAKALTKYGHEERLALATSFVAFYLGARVANWLASGDPRFDDWKHAMEVKVGKNWFGMRSVAGDILRAVADSGKFIYARLNPLYSRQIGDWIYGRDVFTGRKLSATDKLLKRPAEQLIPIQLGNLTRDDQHLWQSFISSMGLQTHQDMPQRDVQTLAREWMKKSGDPKLAAEAERREQEVFAPSDYAPLRAALSDKNLAKAKQKYQELLATKTPQQILKALSTQQHFTGSAKSDALFLSSLGPKEWKLYEQARQQHEELLVRFLQMLGSQ